MKNANIADCLKRYLETKQIIWRNNWCNIWRSIFDKVERLSFCFLKGPKLPFSAVGHAMVTIHNNVIVINGPEIMTLECGKRNPIYFLEDEGPKNYDMIGIIRFGEEGNFCWWVPFGRMQHPR